MSQEIDKYFSSVGLTFPENKEELKTFDKVNENYSYTLKEEAIDPFLILKEIKAEYKTEHSRATNIDYHKRTVLAAEIVYQLKGDVTLGHLKLQKVMYLCQNTTNMALHTNFLQQAMGPYDPVLMRSIDIQFKKREWFEFKHDSYPKYIPLAKCGEHREWYTKYFNDQLVEIESLIKILRNLNTNQVELVATIYACWQRAIKNKFIISDQLLITAVYNWHESKKDKFSETQIINAKEWMNEKGIYPTS